jgi:hypothetical protein
VLKIGFPTYMQIFSTSPAVLLNFLKNNQTLTSQISNSKSTLTLKKFLWRKLFLSPNPSNLYFISNLSSSKRSFLDRPKFA